MAQLTIDEIRKINDESDQLLYELARDDSRLLAPEILLAALRLYRDHQNQPNTSKPTEQERSKQDQVTKPDLTNQTAEPQQRESLPPPYEITPERGSEIIAKCRRLWQEHNTKKSLKQLNRLKQFRHWTRQFTRAERYIALMLLEYSWTKDSPGRLDGKKQIKFRGLDRKQWLENRDQWEREHITTLTIDTA